MPKTLSRGALWHANYGTSKRPETVVVLIVSADEFLALDADTVIVVPLVDTGGFPSRVQIEGAGCGDLNKNAYAACEHIRSIKRDRLNDDGLGMVSDDTMSGVEKAITRLIGLKPIPRSPRGWGV